MMIIEPKTRGFLCTTSHPVGCAKNVKLAADTAAEKLNANAPKRVLVIGSSTGYGLACRITAAFGAGADTIGVFYERPGSEKRTATAGYYNNLAFEKLAKEKGLKFSSLNADAYSKEVKLDTIKRIKDIFDGGQVDLIVYSLAAPKRTDHDGNTFSSVIKPIGESFRNKTVDFHTGTVSEVEIGPGTAKETEETVKVMGGEDWLLWIKALKDAGVLADSAMTVAFSYIGPEMTHPIYKNGTIGKAKEDLEEKAKEINSMLAPLEGKAFVSVNKALVTQASAAIPVVPLYISLLYKVMKEKNLHEDCTLQAIRLFELLYSEDIPTDTNGRIRLDDWEMKPEVQSDVLALWEKVTSENIGELSDIEGYRRDFFALFGFGLNDIDYTVPVEFNI